MVDRSAQRLRLEVISEGACVWLSFEGLMRDNQYCTVAYHQSHRESDLFVAVVLNLV